MEDDFDQHQVNVTHLMAGPPFCELFDLREFTVGTSLVTIAAMIAFGFVTPYSGLDATLGLAFAHPGVLYPFFGTLRGWLGVVLRGSDTASNVLVSGL